tara:strand:- start:703 stop:918 length:216 start_codon:yes stop_codon:yes gene_type:complete
MSFGEAIDLMEHLKDRHRLIMKENKELKDVREFQNKQIEELKEEIEKLKQMVSTTANIGYKFMKKNKPKLT